MVAQRAQILIVEDSADDRNMLSHFLSRKGYRVIKARDRREALDKAFSCQPDFILTDLWLPIISGWDVILTLRADERTKDIPILALSGHTSVPPRGADGCLTKPCQLDELDAEIGRIFEARKGLSESSPGD